MGPKRESLNSPKKLSACMRRRIPFALDATRHPVLPNAAKSNDRYLCPECLEAVVLKSGPPEPHFVHADPQECRLEAPGWMRHSATLAAYAAVRAWIDGDAPRPTIQRTCAKCGTTGEQSLPADLTTADVTCHDQREQLADILLFRGPAAACEVVVVEHLPADVEQWPKRAKGAVVVLRADEVLLAPAAWVPAWEAGLREWRCGGCRAGKPG